MREKDKYILKQVSKAASVIGTFGFFLKDIWIDKAVVPTVGISIGIGGSGLSLVLKLFEEFVHQFDTTDLRGINKSIFNLVNRGLLLALTITDEVTNDKISRTILLGLWLFFVILDFITSSRKIYDLPTRSFINEPGYLIPASKTLQVSVEINNLRTPAPPIHDAALAPAPDLAYWIV